MALEYKVVKAFQSTDQDTKEPQVVHTQGGDMLKYMVQVENQPVQGWMGVLKKPGNAVNVGDILYGDIVTNAYGKPQFNRSQRPQDGVGTTGGPVAAPYVPQAAQTQPSGTAGEKLDYIISLLENFLDSQSSRTGQGEGLGEGNPPIDIDDLNY